jgi:hypothetical protein
MKTKLLSLAGILAILNAKAIEIGPTGSGAEFSGFAVFDYSSQGGDSEFKTSEVELDFDWSTGPVAFSLDVDVYKNGPDDPNGADVDGTNLEEAVLTYTINDNLSVSAGRMLSYLGFEAYDAPNLYQISTAYTSSKFGPLYDGYLDGFSVDYATDMFSIGVWSDLLEKPSFEYAFAYTGFENLTIKYIFGDYGDSSSESKQTVWGSYQLGKLLLAAEMANHKNFGGVATEDEDGWLVMGNYSIADPLSVTVRYSNVETSSATVANVQDVSKFTISPTYMVTDELALLAEYSDIEDDDEFYGIELIYTF